MKAPAGDAGFKNGVVRFLQKTSEHFGAVAQEVFDDSGFRQGRATSEYPEVPGEPNRNRDLSRVRTQYSQTQRHGSGGSFDLARTETFTTVGSRPGAEDTHGEKSPPRRRDTLEVPPVMDQRDHSSSYVTRPARSATQSSQTPSIVIYADPEEMDSGVTVVHASSPEV